LLALTESPLTLDKSLLELDKSLLALDKWLLELDESLLAPAEPSLDATKHFDRLPKSWRNSLDESLEPP